jgi:hypothetical protein
LTYRSSLLEMGGMDSLIKEELAGSMRIVKRMGEKSEFSTTVRGSTGHGEPPLLVVDNTVPIQQDA